MRLLHIRSGHCPAKDNHYHRCDMYSVFALFLLLVLDATTTTTTSYTSGVQVVNALSSIPTPQPRGPRGTAATPMDKKKVVVLGVGGFLGSMTFGFLQRSSSLYGTGIGQVRAMAACGDSASRLNRVLSKQFVLAFADESYIKLTDLSCIDFIAQRLQGFNGLILGDDLEILQRKCTPGSYEKTPNDKVYEAYWPTLAGSVSIKNDNEAEALDRIREQLLNNILQGAKQAGTIQHIVAVTDDNGNGNDAFLSRLKDCGIPYTCLHPTEPWARIPDYTYRKGVQTDLQIQTMSDNDITSPSSSSSSAAAQEPIAMEDMAALCVQCLQSLDWTTSRHLRVSCQGPVTPAMIQQATTTTTAASGPRPPKRPDQDWCVNSNVLERALRSIP
jgi:hypothetical protein